MTSVFRYVMSCNLEEIYRYFGGMCYLNYSKHYLTAYS
jgi:hypothetical protein